MSAHKSQAAHRSHAASASADGTGSSSSITGTGIAAGGNSCGAATSITLHSSGTGISSNATHSVTASGTCQLAPPASSGPAVATVQQQQHVMISYCCQWRCDEHRLRVLALCDALCAHGVEVWRDEDGLRFVGKMEGDAFYQAVERSHTVIVFVSRDYFASKGTVHITRVSKYFEILLFIFVERFPHSRSHGELSLKYFALMRPSFAGCTSFLSN
jgi:hypothetical protein